MSVDTQGVPLIQLHRFCAPHGAHTAAAIEPYRRNVRGYVNRLGMLATSRNIARERYRCGIHNNALLMYKVGTKPSINEHK